MKGIRDVARAVAVEAIRAGVKLNGLRVWVALHATCGRDFFGIIVSEYELLTGQK